MLEAAIIGLALGAALVGLGIGWSLGKADTRRKHAQSQVARLSHVTRELETQSDRLEEAMNGSRLAMWELDMRTGQVNLSANWWALMGGIARESPLPIEQLIDRVPDGEQADCWAAVRAVLRGASSFYDVEHRVRRDDGSTIWIRSRGSVSERSADGRIVRMSGTNLDITARKDAELALDESEAKLRLIADTLPMMLTIIDPELHVVFANRRCAEVLGSNPEAMTGRSLRAFAGEAAERFVRSRLGELATGVDVKCEVDGGEELRLVPQIEGGTLVRIALLGQPLSSSFTQAQNAFTAGASAESAGHTNQ